MLATSPLARLGAAAERPNPNLPEGAGPSVATGADPAGFASLLRQTQRATVPAPQPVVGAPTDAAPAPSTAAAPEAGAGDSASALPESDATDDAKDDAANADAAAPGDPGRSDGAATRPLDTDRHKRPAAKPRVVGAAKNALDGDAASAEAKPTAMSDDRRDATASAHDPNAAHLHARHVSQAAGESAPATAAGRAGEPAAEAEAAASAPRGSAAGVQRPKAWADAATDADAARSARPDAAATGADAAPFAAALSALAAAAADVIPAAPGANPTGSSDASTSAAAAALLASAGPPVAASATAAAAAAAAGSRIAAPLGTPEFVEELGLRLGVLVKEGVQRAELHLNPADLGPVSVQIALDGTQARIDFGADAVQTRQAIEAGLPQLAGALRDAGFTLAGGGVSQHGGRRGQEGGESNGRSGGRHAGPTLTPVGHAATLQLAQAARGIAIPGRLDLFA